MRLYDRALFMKGRSHWSNKRSQLEGLHERVLRASSLLKETLTRRNYRQKLSELCHRWWCDVSFLDVRFAAEAFRKTKRKKIVNKPLPRPVRPAADLDCKPAWWWCAVSFQGERFTDTREGHDDKVHNLETAKHPGHTIDSIRQAYLKVLEESDAFHSDACTNIAIVLQQSGDLRQALETSLLRHEKMMEHLRATGFCTGPAAFKLQKVFLQLRIHLAPL